MLHLSVNWAQVLHMHINSEHQVHSKQSGNNTHHSIMHCGMNFVSSVCD